MAGYEDVEAGHGWQSLGESGWTTFNGNRIRSLDLVRKLRTYRGRLSITEIIRALGGDHTHKVTYSIINNLCRKYEIAVKSVHNYPENRAAAGSDAAKRPREREAAMLAAERKRQAEFLAKRTHEMLRNEIALAIAERPTAPPLKVGNLEW